jgi:hypothetical protein
MLRPTLLLLPTLLALPLAAQRAYRLELSGAAALHTYDSKLELGSALGGALRAGYWITGQYGVELEGMVAHATTSTPLKEGVSTSGVGIWGLANFPVGRRGIFLFKVGYGHHSYGSCPSVSIPGAGPCGSTNVIQAGAGFRQAIKPTVMLRYDVVVNRSVGQGKFTNALVQGGVVLMIGSRPLLDSDGDRVYDRYDRCPGTPLGALTDKHGCPTDRDGDGVPDGLDRCPNTVHGATVDAAGCTQDSDGDGVLDGLDECNDTPPGAVVDLRGCATDQDGDGVVDGVDRCPDTPTGASVDALGCPSDADADGVPDGLDQCPDTAPGAQVDSTGCVPPAPAAGRDTTALDSAGLAPAVVLPGTVWAPRRAVLDSTAFPALDSLARALVADSGTAVVIHGYAQDRLVPADNTRLSAQRAEAVGRYLVKRGIRVTRITAVGRGSLELLVPDTSEVARRINRRVEILILPKP